MLLSLIVSGLIVGGTVQDSLVAEQGARQVKEGSERNVMLNAEAANKPREINIGLSAGDMGTIVLEDGMLMNYPDFPMYQYHHWAGGNAYSAQDLKPMEECVIYAGKIFSMMDSYSKLGGDRISGAFTAATSSFGRIKFDGQIGGPIAKGFSYSVSAFINKDPGSVRPPQVRFFNDMQVYKAGLTKYWRGGSVSLIYKISLNDDLPTASNYGPFYYVGDGSIRGFEGFRLGRDNYYPSDDRVTLIDCYDGHRIEGHMFDGMNDRVIQDASLLLKLDDVWGWKLSAGLHPCWAGHFQSINIVNSGISRIDGGQDAAGRAVTLADGTPFSGFMQTRSFNHNEDKLLDIIGNISLKKTIGGHDITLGMDELYDDQFYRASTSIFAHTVEKNPERIYVDGQSSWKFNLSSKYVDGWSNLTSVYGMDKWDVSRKLFLQLGLRAGLQTFGSHSAANPPGETYNNRRDGFFVKDGICRPIYRRKNDINFSTVVKADWNVAGRLHAVAEHLFNRISRLMVVYFNQGYPSDDPTDIQLSRAWLRWAGDKLDISSAVSYITKENSKSSVNASKVINGTPETVTYLCNSNMGTFGWTTDATLSLGGFKLHGMLTIQEPKYTDYENDVHFSDGSVEHVKYTGNYTSGISRVLVEIDPSYTWGKWRVWASARYFSKQYANRVNNVCFNGHWETFAGAKYNLAKNLSLSADIVNVLNKKGAKGKIDAADTITDNSLLRDYLISGTFIIPFTVNFSVSYKF